MGASPFRLTGLPTAAKHGGFYAADGRSLKQAFLRSPLEYTRVSSGFSGSRTHPIFGYDAAHRGVDYSAATGTNVRSIAEGVVTFAGWQRGYGNVVEIRHDGKHATLYAHLQSVTPGLRQGLRIGQGDSVGTVGMTGWATGPHLHFELKVHDQHVNPLTAELPAAEPLAASQLEYFARTAGSAARSAGSAGTRKHCPRPPALVARSHLAFYRFNVGHEPGRRGRRSGGLRWHASEVIGSRIPRISQQTAGLINVALRHGAR